MTPQQLRQAQQSRQAQEQAKIAAQQRAKGQAGAAAKSEPKVHIVVNQRNNSLLVNAPPDKMAIIERAILVLDVPVGAGRSLLAAMSRMQIYRLAAIDPEPLVKTLEELGCFDPNTRLEVDKQNKAIIAYATLADHATIRQVVDKLDGSGRSFEVIPLRRLEADYVAGTIEFMMAGEKETQPQYPRYIYSSRSSGQSQEKPDEFRVDADVERNRLLLWANDLEVEEVMSLLVKLGEIPPQGGNRSKVRVLDGSWGPETEAWLERVRRAWPSVAPNRLIAPPKEAQQEGLDTAPEEESPRRELPSGGTRTQILPGGTLDRDEVALAADARRAVDSSAYHPRPVHFAQFSRNEEAADPGQAAESAAAESATLSDAEKPPAPKGGLGNSPAPIQISRGTDGRLVLTSEDTQALDLLEDLMGQLAPPRIDYKIFQLKYAWAYGIALTLEEIFEEQEKDSRSSRYPYIFFYDPYNSGSDNKERARLSKRPPLKFISDPDSNSILVQGADPGQLAKIEKLIEFYDQPEPVDSQSVRKMKLFQLRHAKATTVAEAIKDIYRDLLSSNDKALMNAKQRQTSERSYTYVYDSGDGLEQKAPRFKGLLSIGINELSNTLIVSAPTHLLDDVSELIEQLDEAARPTTETVYVLKVQPGVDVSQMQEKLSRVLGSRVGRAAGFRKKATGGTGKAARRRSAGQIAGRRRLCRVRGRPSCSKPAVVECGLSSSAVPSPDGSS